MHSTLREKGLMPVDADPAASVSPTAASSASVSPIAAASPSAPPTAAPSPSVSPHGDPSASPALNGGPSPAAALNGAPSPAPALNGAPQPPVSVVVAATDHRPTLPRCLEAINASRDAHDELIVVSDAALIGPASARNHGALSASNPILVFVDADVEVRHDALSLIRKRFAADPGLTALFGSYDDDPEERDVVSTFRNLLHHYVHQGSGGSVGSFWAGLGAVRRDAFEQVGGFDTRIARASVEDIEFGGRLRTTGRIELDPRIQGKHLKRWTLSGMLFTDLERRGIPWTRLAMRGRATRSELNLAWPHKLSALASLMMAVSLARRRAAAATAWLGILCLINQRFYRLLAVRGRRHLLGGIGLHVAHHLTSVMALLVGILGLSRRGADDDQSPW